MKINGIKIDRNYNNSLELTKLTAIIDFDTANPSDKPDGDALYYLICALDKCCGKSHKDLDFSESLQVLNRLDAAISKLQQIKKEIEKD